MTRGLILMRMCFDRRGSERSSAVLGAEIMRSDRVLLQHASQIPRAATTVTL
jgi:hypothetical protein